MPRRSWRNVVNRESLELRITANREPNNSDNLGEEIVEALRRRIQEEINADDTIRPNHHLHFVLQTTTNVFNHPFQSTTFNVHEFENYSPRLEAYMMSLAGKLNSNESFDFDTPLYAELTFIRTPGEGSGNGKRYKPANAAIRKISKRSVISIKNDDSLCCARAIVTMKARADEGPQGPTYKNLKKGRPIQERMAKELCRQAGVQEGPCGLDEIDKFQAVLPNHQIKVISIDPPYCIIYKGKKSSPLVIQLIKTDNHYDGCSSFAGFLSKSYYCHECDKGFDHDDYLHHPCDGKWCACCKTKDCTDYLTNKKRDLHPKPLRLCHLCNRKFYGDGCLAAHYKSDLCKRHKRCVQCEKHYFKDAKFPNHKCGYNQCPYCGKYVNLEEHQCYIQPEPEDCDAPKLKTVDLKDVGLREIISRNEETGKATIERDPPLLVYADYEALKTPEGYQKPIMVCAESEEEDETNTFYGEDCTETFFEYLDNLCVDQDGDDRQVIVLFHNLKGYDGMFILQHLYKTHRPVTNQVTVGIKLFSLQSDLITFKDSLCFLPMPLKNFTATFGLSELKKGFFPHLFNTHENKDYVGPMPPKEMYDPDGMTQKEKHSFEIWYNSQVQDNFIFNMRQEMESYCISDVKLLKHGCIKFQSEFQEQAGFRPMEKCITIASSCHRFWRKKMLPKNTIATEPVKGWKGC